MPSMHPQPSPSHGPAASAGRRRGSVLVIDDEYGARLQVELALLTSDVAEVAAEAYNGMRGAELAEQLQPDVVVLDLSMPVMDGFEALPLIRTVAPDSVVLVRSNVDAEEAVVRAIDLGAHAFIPKFVSPDDLQSQIEHAVAAHDRPFPPIPHRLRELAASAR